jgi:hypothetical protein
MVGFEKHDKPEPVYWYGSGLEIEFINGATHSGIVSPRQWKSLGALEGGRGGNGFGSIF